MHDEARKSKGKEKKRERERTSGQTDEATEVMDE